MTSKRRTKIVQKADTCTRSSGLPVRNFTETGIRLNGLYARLDVPITHINASYVRSHFDAMEVGCNDAPRADEILLALVMSTGARVHERVGGLRPDAIKGEDGLR